MLAVALAPLLFPSRGNLLLLLLLLFSVEAFKTLNHLLLLLPIKQKVELLIECLSTRVEGMALEAVVFPQGLFGYNGKELYGLGGEVWDCGGLEEEGRSWGLSCSSVVQSLEEWDMMNSSSPEAGTTNKEGGFSCELGKEEEVEALGRRKRRRTRSHKNKEEVENQRMTHIAVERNRRKQMNEYLAVLRSLMPANYVQRGDQASIIGGAINFVKELEQLLQSLEAHKRIKQQSNGEAGSSSLPFASFFSFPQYSSCSSVSANTNTSTMNTNNTTAEVMAKNRSAVADIEVTMVESHANLKILAPRRPKQLLKIVLGLQGLRLTTLHLNVTTVDEMVLHSFSLKVEDDCRLNSVDEIATAVYQMVGRIQEEANVI